MFFQHPPRTRVAAFFAASCMALALNGSILLGFDAMASQSQASVAAVGRLDRSDADQGGIDATL